MKKIIKKFLDFFDDHRHLHQESKPVILYKNHQKISRFCIINFIISGVVNSLVMSFYYQGTLAAIDVAKLLQFYITIVMIAGIFILPYHPEHYGFNFNKLKFNLIIGFGIGIPGFLCAVLGRYYMVQMGYHEFGFICKSVPAAIIKCILYPFDSVSQEIVTKGYIQGLLISVFRGYRFNRILAIICAALLFAQFHLFLGIHSFIIIFLFAFLTGFLYEKSRSVVGIAMIHFFIGAGLFIFSEVF